MNSTVTSHENDKTDFENELKPGTELLHGQYVIEQFLNNGGFGITYLAKDSLHRQVVIKECFPEAICRRDGTAVRVRSRTQVENFRTIVDMFIEEARNLARLSHPNIVGVHQVFEDNETAYMAMDFVKGRDLLEIIEAGETLAPAEIEVIAGKLLNAVGFIHREGVLHRDIAPDNVLLSAENSPVLIDFGAAQVTVSPTESYLGSMRTVKDGYSPQEFYSKDARHDPSSDLYSLAASLYHVMTKELPANAQRRMSAIANGEPDPYVSVKGKVSGYSKGFLEAIDRALSVFPKDRLTSAEEWRALLPRSKRSRPMLAVENGSVLEQFEEKARTSIESVRKWSERTNLSRMLMSGSAGSASKAAETPEDLSAAIKRKPKTGLYIGVGVIALLGTLGAITLAGNEETQLSENSAADVPEVSETIGAAEPIRPQQLPFFLENGSAGDVEVSSASGTLGARSTAADFGALVSTQEAEPAPEQTAGLTADGATLPFRGQPAAQVDRVAPVPTTETQAPTQGSAIAVLESGTPVLTRSAVSFPVVAETSDPTIVLRAEGPLADVLSPGQRVLSVNGFPIEALSDFHRVVEATSDFAVGDTVTIAFGIQNPSSGEVFVREIGLVATQQTMLLNGVQFETTADGDVWSTVVKTGSGTDQSDLQAGDKVVALMPNNELIDSQNALPTLIERDLAAGATDFNFAVQRDGQMWLVNMRYTGGSAD